MAAKGQRGIKGTPHWKVEAEVRGPTGLTAAWCLQSASWVVTQLVTPALRGALAGVCSQPCVHVQLYMTCSLKDRACTCYYSMLGGV